MHLIASRPTLKSLREENDKLWVMLADLMCLHKHLKAAHLELQMVVSPGLREQVEKAQAAEAAQAAMRH